MKISLAAENERTVFQKLREAALAYHLTRRWSKEQILRNYLNSIYFGNGAYGIESAARTYFEFNHDRCGEQGASRQCASVLLPHEAALLAGDGRLPERLRPGPASGRGQAPARPRAAADVRAGLSDARRCTTSAKAQAAADARRPHVPEGGHGLPVLHLLDQAAGRRPARRRPAGRAARVRGRPAGQDDDRLAPPACGREGDQRAGCRTGGGPRASLVAISNKRRHGAGDGRRRQLRRSRRSTSPPRASASPARRSSRSCSPRRCART